MLSLTRWNPFDELTTLHRDMDRVFGRAWSEAPAAAGFVPATEVASDDDAWYVRVALPGVDPKAVQIEVVGSTLTIRGERTGGHEESKTSHLSEIAYGRFERTFTMPGAVDTNRVTASYENGILKLTLPVQEAAKPRRIEISGDAIKAVKVA